MVEIAPIGIEGAKKYFEEHSAFRGEFNIAICAKEGDMTHGVIACYQDGVIFEKRQISTDGNAQVGTLLYGAMVRVAMALGYKQLTL